MQISLKSKPIILVLGCGMGAVILSLLTQHMDFENSQENEKWDSLFFSMSISLIGIALFTLRRIGQFTEFIESLELLIFLILPVLALMPALIQDPMNLAIFFPVYFFAVISWLLIVKYFFVDHMKKSKEKRYTESNVKILWGMLMLFGAMALGIFIFITLPYLVNSPPG